jgi:hypothetical protein
MSMLPTLAAVVMGSAATQSAASGGLQGMLGSLMQSASALDGNGGNAGGIGGMLSGMLGGLMDKKSA